MRKQGNPELGSEYFIPVTTEELDSEVILWMHAGQGDPIYALGSRLVAYGETDASPVELETLADVLEKALMQPDPSWEDNDVIRMSDLLESVQVVLNEYEQEIERDKERYDEEQGAGFLSHSSTRKQAMPQDYSHVTNEMFDRKLEEIVEEQKHALLSIPGVWEVASEEGATSWQSSGEDFEKGVEGALAGMSAGVILSIPGMYEVLSEELNNDVLAQLEEERDMRGASTERHAAPTQQQEDVAWELGREYGQEHPLAEVRSSEEMYQAAQSVGVGLLFDVFKYGAQSVWRETGQMRKATMKKKAYSDKPLNHWDRYELQQYLENRGFAVYDDEPTDDLREAVRMDMEEEGMEFDVEPPRSSGGYGSGMGHGRDPYSRRPFQGSSNVRADKELFQKIAQKLDETKSSTIARSMLKNASALALHILAEMGARPLQRRRFAGEEEVKDVNQSYTLFKDALGRLNRAPNNDAMIEALDDVVKYGTGILQAIK